MVVSNEKNHKTNDKLMGNGESIKEISIFRYVGSTIRNDAKDFMEIRR